MHQFVDYDSITGAINRIDTDIGGTASVQALEYFWDPVGNLTKREDENQAVGAGVRYEEFLYDAADRLYEVQLNGATTAELEYNGIVGNITKKTDVSTSTWSYVNQAACSAYAYSYTQPHAVRKAGSTVYCYDAVGNMVKRGSDTISWYHYNLPSVITQSSGNSAQLFYGADRQRYKQISTSAGTTETTIYIGGLYEKITQLGQSDKYRHYIRAAGQTVAIHTRYSSGGGSPTTSYLLPDHLGSVDKIVDGAGGVISLSYDAFGKRRKSDWTAGSPIDPEQIYAATHRGFTFHEHLDAVGLIHMNGRVYDPTIGRFASADPFVPEPFNTQSLNRYSYVDNNPLSWIDPSGFRKKGCIDCNINPGLISFDVFGIGVTVNLNSTFIYTFYSRPVWHLPQRSHSGGIPSSGGRGAGTDLQSSVPAGSESSQVVEEEIADSCVSVTLVCRPVHQLGVDLIWDHCATFVSTCDAPAVARVERQYSMQGSAVAFDKQPSDSDTSKRDLEAFKNPGGRNVHHPIAPPEGVSPRDFADTVIQYNDAYPATPYVVTGPNSSSAAAFGLYKANAEVPTSWRAVGLDYYSGEPPREQGPVCSMC